MPRSRRFIALASLIAALAWTNVQAMTCCWSLGLADALDEAAFAASSPSSPENEAVLADAGEPAHAACHGPAATPSSSATPEAEAPLAKQAPTSGQASTSSTVACTDVATALSSTPSTTSTASCCDAPAPAESFSAILRLEALPPHAFYAAATAPSAIARTFDQHALHSPGAPRFLALERLLI